MALVRKNGRITNREYQALAGITDRTAPPGLRGTDGEGCARKMRQHGAINPLRAQAANPSRTRQGRHRNPQPANPTQTRQRRHKMSQPRSAHLRAPALMRVKRTPSDPPTGPGTGLPTSVPFPISLLDPRPQHQADSWLERADRGLSRPCRGFITAASPRNTLSRTLMEEQT